MHSIQLAEFAAWLSVHSASVVAAFDLRSGEALRSLDEASATRRSLWESALSSFERELIHRHDGANPWPSVEMYFDEIIVSELLTRVWSATLVKVERTIGTSGLTTKAQQNFVDHIQIKNRILRTMLQFQDEQPRLIQRFNHLRQSVEKWTDVFLAMMSDWVAARSFAFDRERVNDFASEHALYEPIEMNRRIETLSVSVGNALRSKVSPWTACPDSNRRMVDSILTCIGHHAFDLEQLPASVQKLWREKSHSEAQILIEQILRLDA